MTDLSHANGHDPDAADDFLMSDDAPPTRPKGPYARGTKEYARLGWTGIIPINPKTKIVSQDKITGRDGKQLRPDQYAGPRAIKKYGASNIGWRVPVGIVGLDVDDYDGKTGAATLAELEEALGPLPKTWTSTSRGMDAISRIHFFQIPEDTGELRPFAGRDIDVIQHHHRYAQVWPSVHPKTDAEYRWYRPSGELCATAPEPDAFAVLPDAWLEYLGKAQRDVVPGAGAGVSDFLAEATGNDEPEIIQFILDAFDSQPGGRHDSMMIALGWAARAAADWKIPATEVFDFLEAAWDEATDGEDRDQEFQDLLERAVADAPAVRNPENAGAVASLLARLLSPADLDNLPTPAWLIDGWLTENTFSRMNGQPNSGKSLTVLDWAGCIGTGIPWQGNAVVQGNVVYVVAEGAEGFAKRKRAWEGHYGQPMENVFFLPEPLQIMGKEWATFVQVCRQLTPKLIVFDTQRRVTRGIDENDNTLMGDAGERIEDLRKALRACCLLVHHTPKHGEDGAGAGAISAMVHTEFLMTKIMGETNRYILRNTKEKDAAEGARITMVPEIHQVPGPNDDPFMDDVTSIILVPEDREDEATAPVPGLDDDAAASRRQVINAINQVWVRANADDFAKAEVKSVLVPTALAKATFYRSWNELVDQGLITPVFTASGAESKTRFRAVFPEDLEDALEFQD